MYRSNIRGIWKLFQQKPQLVHLTAINLRHRLVHNFRSNGSAINIHPPELFTVVLTDRCNLRCVECHYAYSEVDGYQLNQVGGMNIEIYCKVLKELNNNPIVSITGGEPLLHQKVADFIAYAKANNHLCTLVTNGWLLAKRAQELCNAGLDILTVSFDGPQDIHNSIRGKGSYERIIAGIDGVLRQPDRPIIFISMTISNMNFDQVESTYALAKSLGVDGMNINHLWMQTDEMVKAHNTKFALFPAEEVTWFVDPELVDVSVLADDLETVRRRNWGSDFVFSESPFLNRTEIADWYKAPARIVKYETVRCAWIRFRLWPDGKVKPCREWDVGDASCTHAMDIWNGEHIQSFRQTLATNGMLPICTRCCQIAYR